MKKEKISFTIICILSTLLCCASCKTTDIKGEMQNLNFVKTSTIKPDKQKGYNKKENFYVELQQASEKGSVFTKRQNVILRIYGKLDGDLLNVTDIYWFDNNATGWTEANFAASGQLKILPGKSPVYYKVITPVELEFVQKAKLRIKDSVLIGDIAIQTLNNKIDRIQAAIEFLKEPSDFVKNPRFFTYFSFEAAIGPYLFPERYSYLGTASKYAETKNFGKNRGNVVFHDGIIWNNEYTEAAFPEYMWDVRNSGTLYKDWEQDFDLFYYLYCWEFFFGEDANMGLIKKKSWK